MQSFFRPSLYTTLCLALLLPSCNSRTGGGGGAADSSTVSLDIRPVLDNAAAPNGALQDLATEIDQSIATSADPHRTGDQIMHDFLDSLQTQADFDDLLEAMQNSGSVFLIGNPNSAVSPATALPAATALAGATSVNCPEVAGEETAIYFINGVMNTPTEAMLSASELKQALRAQGSSLTDNTSFRWFYNRSGLDNRTTEEMCTILAYALALYANLPALPVFVDALLAAAQHDAAERCAAAYGLVADFGQAAIQRAEDLIGATPSQSEVIQFRNVLAQDINSGKKVLVIAHSQGNIIADQAIGGLPSDVTTEVGVVAVASPTNYPQSSARLGTRLAHQTLQRDFILQLPGAFPANGSNPVSDDAFFASASVHSFRDSYLAHAQSRAPLVSSALAVLSDVDNQREGAGQGYFQVTLTWSIAGDIDLHVFEPGGTEVYYGNPVGQYGELDRDDLVGTGPENYFVCHEDELAAGSYRIEVDNFSGTAGTVATIAVRAGNEIKGYSVTMGASSAPNQVVATVTYQGNGVFLVP